MATNGAYELPLTLIVRGYVVRYLCESITLLRLLACGTIVLGFVTLCEAPNTYGPNEARNQALEPRNRALGGPCPLVISHVDPLGPSSHPGGNILALFGSGLAHVRPQS
mgnify:CR=1 FL=1